MTGADRYTDAVALLREAHDATGEAKALLLAEAQIHATLAVAAAQALAVVTPFVGDSPELTEWARLVARGASASYAKPERPLPEHWPPVLGDVWRDDRDDLWLYESSGKLVCLADDVHTTPVDGTPDAVEDKFGPMVLVARRFSQRCPF